MYVRELLKFGIEKRVVSDSLSVCFCVLIRNKCIGEDTKATARQTQTALQQELSYRQQIARQLRTQYAEGIYRPHKYYTVTLKSRLRVTQDHWKRNHWIGHTRLSSSRVI